MAIYRIAGLQVEMSPQSALLKKRSAPYLSCTDAPAQMRLHGEGEDTAEYARVAQSFYEQLLSFDGFLLHASAVCYNGRAYAFSAPSGTGKSTHAAFWEQQFGAQIINDDKPAIRRIDGAFCACGTPFSGKTDKSKNICVPLGAIAFLHREEENTARRLTAKEALLALLNATLRPNDENTYTRFLLLLEALLEEVPVWSLGCTLSKEAAFSAREALLSDTPDIAQKRGTHGVEAPM